MSPLKRNNSKPEWHIQQALIEFLEHREWEVDATHGSVYQTGFPDLFIQHVRWGTRWIDCKVKGRYSFTNAQKIKWPKWEKKGTGIWILTAADQSEYDKLFKPPNFRDYWKAKWGDLPDIDKLLDEIRNERRS